MAIDSPPGLRLIPFIALFYREVRRFMRIFFQTIASPLINVTLYLLIFGLSLGRQIDKIDGYTYLAFLIPGVAMMGSVRNAFDNAAGSIITSKFCGELEDFKIVPLSPSQIIWANGLAASFRGFLVALITFFIGEVFYLVEMKDLVSISHPFLALFFLIIGSFAYANLGLASAMLCRSFDQVNALNTFILLPLIYLGGVFFSLHQLDPIWQNISHFNPLLYLINGMRYSVIGVSDVDIGISIVVTLLSAVAFNMIAWWSLKVGDYHRW